jgi:Zn-dependent protease
MVGQITLFDGAVWYVVFLFSTTVHEASHAFAALRLGDDTAYRGGQVSLDPTPHVKREPFGMVVVPILSYLLGGWMIGWASAPYDPHWANRHPRRAGLMALAGPVSNFVLMLACGLLIRLGMLAGFFSAPQSIEMDHVTEATRQGIPFLFATLLSVGFTLNLLLFLFNLLPFPPLDGGSVPLIFLSETAAEKYWEILRAPAFAMFGLFVAWKISGAIFPSAHLLAVNLLYPGHHYTTW